MRVARRIVEGSERLQYQKLWDYCEELRRQNPNSTFDLTVHRPTLELPPTFDICFNANVQGFKEGCRPFIGLDECFLKGYYGGQLLSAVAQDVNRHFYVIAVAVVEQESRDTWSWFLRNLLGDIGQYSDNESYKFQVWKMPQCKVVDLGAGTCNCRMWQLTGILCAHAIACMAYNNLEPDKFIHSWYSTERWRATYVPYIEPITGESDWHCTELPPIEPPAFKRPAGRPKQRRRHSNGEASTSGNSSRATRKYGEIHCSRCGEAGHNIRRCMNEATNDAPNMRGNRRTSEGLNAYDS
ncbi:uncharacterized protein LOC116193879 [Punica granatum]|uniref:Uncharacterized protein LOC116193879 n=1 Tax=Punica granatum TaxID=22663 RepID=A0A6P8C6N7_PUNGR|nr:uncharacterized protein LOC116193879 [Punica granatum]